MYFLDRTKLAEHRELVDAEITRIVLSDIVSRPVAYSTLANEIGFYLSISIGSASWASGFAVPLDLVETNPSRKHGCGYTSASANALNEFLRHQELTGIVGNYLDDVATAILLRCLDEDVDVFLDAEPLSKSALSEWELVARGQVDLERELRDPEQPVLFETDQEYSSRRKNLMRWRNFNLLNDPIETTCEIEIAGKEPKIYVR